METYPKVSLAKFIHDFFLENYIKFCLLGVWKFLRKDKKYFKRGIFYFSSSESYFLKCKKFFKVSVY